MRLDGGFMKLPSIKFNVASATFFIFVTLTFVGCSQIVQGRGDAAWNRSATGNEVSQKFILQNDEKWEVFTNQDPNNPRWFYVNDPIQVEACSDTEIKITSYCLEPIYYVKVYAEIFNYSGNILAFTIPEVKPLSQTVYKLPFCQSDGTYFVSNGKTVDIPKVESISNGMMTFSVESVDRLYNKIKSIRANWRITFGTYGSDGNHASWIALTPIFCREWISAITNFAYAVSSKETETLLSTTHYANCFGQPMHNGNNLTTDDEYKAFFRNTLATGRGVTKNLNLGILRGGNVVGLGGGATLGISRWYFYEQYTNFGSAGTIMHELGHCVGWGHGSSMAYGEFEYAARHICNLYIRTGEMPYPDMNTVGLYKPENAQYRISRSPSGVALDSNTVDTNMRPGNISPRRNLSDLEKYIMDNKNNFPEAAAKLKAYMNINPDLFSLQEHSKYNN